jgi:hypothetical protein
MNGWGSRIEGEWEKYPGWKSPGLPCPPGMPGVGVPGAHQGWGTWHPPGVPLHFIFLDRYLSGRGLLRRPGELLHRQPGLPWRGRCGFG